MKKTFEIGTGIFGEGKPKVCVPIVEKTREEIFIKAEEIRSLPIDIVEWRADFYEEVFQDSCVQETLAGLKERLGEKALLFTFRTAGEGGNRAAEKECYYELNRAAAASGCADLVDVEAFLDEERTGEEIRVLQNMGSHVIASNHDFEKTPEVHEMVRRLTRMSELGAHVAKLAVMPRSRQDVLNLLQATLEADEKLEIPVVTMSMGSSGVVSRIAGSLTGSAMTFAAVGKTSAPGQIEAEQMLKILECVAGS